MKCFHGWQIWKLKLTHTQKMKLKANRSLLIHLMPHIVATEFLSIRRFLAQRMLEWGQTAGTPRDETGTFLFSKSYHRGRYKYEYVCFTRVCNAFNIRQVVADCFVMIRWKRTNGNPGAFTTVCVYITCSNMFVVSKASARMITSCSAIKLQSKGKQAA